MKKIYFIILTIILTIAQYSCSKMDDTYRQFLEGGAITYSEKPDSIKTHSGRNRIVISWKSITDPRVKTLKVFWDGDSKSKEMNITSEADTTILIDGLTEGNHIFNLYTYDTDGNKSVKAEAVGQAYDTLYERGLILREIDEVSLTGTNLKIYYKAVQNAENYAHQEIRYISSETNTEKTVTIPASQVELTLTDFIGDGFTHRSVYKPQPLSPDYFYSASRVVYTPANPLLAEPANGAMDVSVAPEFKWYNSVLMTGATYRVLYSTDAINWTTVVVTGNQSLIPATILNANTKYYWKVTATQGATVRESNVQTFTTGAKTMYANGEVKQLQASTSGYQPVKIILTGDGFQQQDYLYDGPFDRYISEAVEAFFSVEPFKSYRNYFEVWQVAAYSTDAGVSESDKRQTLNTAFSSTYTGTTITVNNTDVYNAAKKVPGITDDALTKTPIIVLLNRKREGGATVVSADNKTVALVPIYKTSVINSFTSFKDVIIRQGGGFAFGLLADESSAISGTLTSSEITKLQADWAAGRSLNIDLVSNPNSVRWAHFIGRSGYERPGVYEGAYGYKTGVYRSEENSAMSNGINYFNAISRELIVKRIMSIAGEAYTLDKFLQKDVSKTPYN